MGKRTVVILLLAVMAFAHVCLADDGGQKTLTFSEWKFSAEIPSPYDKSTVLHGNDTLDCEVFVNGDFVYIVKIAKTPAGKLASTHIEQSIQADLKSAPAGTARRWELDSRQGELFKGLTRPLKDDLAGISAVVKALGNEPGVQSVSMVPLADEKSPILTIGVIARESLKTEAELRANTVAAFVRFDRLEAKPKPVVVAPPTPPAPEPPKPVAKKPVPPKPVVKPTPKYTLRSGDIELSGTVTSIADDSRSLEMSVDTVRMPGESPVKLDPARPKKVLVASVPARIREGARITIAGRNTGIGKAIRAEFVAGE